MNKYMEVGCTPEQTLRLTKRYLYHKKWDFAWVLNFEGWFNLGHIGFAGELSS